MCPDPGRGAYLPHGRWRTPLYIEEHVFFVFDNLGCRDGWTEGARVSERGGLGGRRAVLFPWVRNSTK